MKKKLSYRDKLIELAQIYDVKEIKDYVKRRKNLTTGQLELDDSTQVGLYWVLDGAAISFQMVATDTDTAAGQQLYYEIVQGALPTGVTLSKSGLISGIVKLTDEFNFSELLSLTIKILMRFFFLVSFK